MTPELLADVLAHARVEAPREASGVILAIKDHAVFVPVRNISEDPDRVVWDQVGLAAAEDRGPLVGYVHSHPGGRAVPSEADLEAQEATGLPWWIVVPETGEWIRFGAAPTVGRPFAWGVQDCYAVASDLLGLPDFVRDQETMATMFETQPDILGREVTHAAPGDVLLFGVHSQRVNHCAVYLGDGRMAHHLPGRLSVIENIGGWATKILRTMRRAA